MRSKEEEHMMQARKKGLQEGDNVIRSRSMKKGSEWVHQHLYIVLEEAKRERLPRGSRTEADT